MAQQNIAKKVLELKELQTSNLRHQNCQRFAFKKVLLHHICD